MISITKRYDNFPFAHRQPDHKGHCRLIHGHNWSFEFEFLAMLHPGTRDARVIGSLSELKEHDPNGFIVDFGDLKWLKQWLDSMFDHTLVLNHTDPGLSYIKSCMTGAKATGDEVKLGQLANINTVPNCGAEGLADFVFRTVSVGLQNRYTGKVSLKRVTVFEDSKNSATFHAP